MLGTLLAALVAGAGAATGSLLLAGLISGALLGVIYLLIPLSWAIWLLLVAVYLVAGQLQYFAHVSKAFWIPYLIGLALFLRWPIDSMRANTVVRERSQARLIAFLVSFFLMIAAFSSLANRVPIAQFLLSLKEYVFLWSLFFIIASGHVAQATLDRAWLAALWLVPAQVPVVLYQRFVVAPRRLGETSWDAVVGLFGGNPNGGGASGAMAIFVLFATLLAVALWRRRALSGFKVLVVALCAIACIGLAEVKFAIFLLPVGVLLIFRGEFLRRPILFLFGIVLSLSVSFLLVWGYKTQFSSDRAPGGESLSAYVELAIDRSTDSDYVNLATGEMSRGAAIKLWWSEHSLDDPSAFLIGHGIGATRAGAVSGEVARGYRWRIDRSSLAIFLWETGVMGVAAIVGLLITGAVLAARLAKRAATSRVEAAALDASFVGLVLLLLSLPYNTDVANLPSIQVLLWLMLGQITLSQSRYSSPTKSQQASATAAPAGYPGTVVLRHS